MISYDGLLLHNKHKCKHVLVTKLAENIIEGKEMKNHKQLIRIFLSLIFFPHSFCYRTILILVTYFLRKRGQSIRLTRHTLNPPLNINFIFNVLSENVLIFIQMCLFLRSNYKVNFTKTCFFKEETACVCINMFKHITSQVICMVQHIYIEIQSQQAKRKSSPKIQPPVKTIRAV